MVIRGLAGSTVRASTVGWHSPVLHASVTPDGWVVDVRFLYSQTDDASKQTTIAIHMQFVLIITLGARIHNNNPHHTSVLAHQVTANVGLVQVVDQVVAKQWTAVLRAHATTARAVCHQIRAMAIAATVIPGTLVNIVISV